MQSEFSSRIKRVFSNFRFSVVDTIVISFAAIAKFNVLLMTDQVSNEDKSNLLIFIKRARILFQSLLKTVAIFFSLNSRSRSAISTASIFDSLKSVEKESVNKKILKYRQDKKRSNVHIDFHYENMMNHYDLTTHCNVLMKENKHR